MAVPYLTDFDPQYGSVVEVSPHIRRVVADNASRYTFKGTGTYIVGRGQVAVIDPGPADDDHVAALLAALSGEEVSHIVITHTHRDHCPAWRALQTATGAPTYGFGPHPVPDVGAARRATPTTSQSLEPTEEELAELRAATKAKAGSEHDQDEPGDLAFSPDVELNHGDVLAGGNWTLQTLHTPGHISNHLCFAFPEEQSVFTGDHVMGWSTSVVPSPEGSMRDYLASLELLTQRDDRYFYPTHGPRIPDPIAFTHALIEHRRDREHQILDCLAKAPCTIPELVTEMYRTTTPHILYMAAGQSVYSHLVHMSEDGRVACDGEPSADGVYRLP